MLTTGPILLMIDTTMAYFRGILRGIRRNSDPRVWLHSIDARPEIVSDLAALKPLGLIGQIRSPELGDAVASLRIPAVNISNLRADERYPYVGTDGDAIGRMAAEHLIARGFRHFGYFGIHDHVYSQARRRGFKDEMLRSGFELFDAPEALPPAGVTRGETVLMNVRQMIEWLNSLPKPIAIFCGNDLRARRLAEAASQAELRVPEDVAILGVDNDDVTCALTSPPLSSIALPDENVGYEAAAMLARMIRGDKVPPNVLLKPLAIVTRESTDTLAVHDDDIADAVRFIRDHAFEDITVEDVLREVPLSRRWLEHKFERILGRTPAEEIRRLRLERAKDLLATTDLSMPEVAKRSGFTNAKHLAASFRTFEDITPTEYRSTHRQRA